MLWRNLCLVRALAASGLLSITMFGTSQAGEPGEPIPGPESQAETVSVLDAEKAGQLTVEVRGHGEDRVRVSIRNTSTKRLNVVLPPGLVAASSTGQGGAGAGGFQSMGLGSSVNRAGGFGQFAGPRAAEPGFRSIAPSETEQAKAVMVPLGQKVDVEIPSVCLNFGLPTPTAKDKFRLVDVDDYSKDARVRKALRSLATYGTSHGTAQAAMWRVCNNLPFEVMLERADKAINASEVALAARFVDALDNSTGLVDPAYLAEARIFLTIEGDQMAAKDAKRLASSIDGLRILGMPVRVLPSGETPKSVGPALHLGLTLSSAVPGETRGRVVVQSTTGLGEVEWSTLGSVNFKDASALSSIDVVSLARGLDHAVGSAFVTAKVARRATGSTTLKIENRLPFSVTSVTVKAGASSGSALITVNGLGVGPGRSGLTTIPAANGTVDRVELNGL